MSIKIIVTIAFALAVLLALTGILIRHNRRVRYERAQQEEIDRGDSHVLHMLVSKMRDIFPSQILHIRMVTDSFSVRISLNRDAVEFLNPRIPTAFMEFFSCDQGLIKHIDFDAWALLEWYLDSAFTAEPPAAAYTRDISVHRLHDLYTKYFEHNSGFESPKGALSHYARERNIAAEELKTLIQCAIDAIAQYRETDSTFETATSLVYVDGLEIAFEDLEFWYRYGGDLRDTNGAWVARTGDIPGRHILRPWRESIRLHDERSE